MLSRLSRRSFSTTPKRIVSVRYEDLLGGVDLRDAVYEAYGPKGLGAITISGVPGYAEARKRLLPLSHSVAHLPSNVKQTLEHEPSMWNVGWSHGREKLGDVPDMSKGSFYANPLYDSPGTDESREKHPFFFPKNIWPKQHLPQVEPAFKKLGKIMYEATVLLSQQIDHLAVTRVPNYPNKLAYEMKNTEKIKGRLLYYYPLDSTTDDGWIGWHNDTGFLTALSSDQYYDDDTGKPIPNPDPNGGLWIVDREGGAVKVQIPEDEIAVQCGECLQIITGGLLVATPHCVRASKSPQGVRVGRASFPVFIDVAAGFPLSPPAGHDRAQVFDKTVESRVPPLEKRWLRDGVPFVEFLGDSFKMYYEWSKKGK